MSYYLNPIPPITSGNVTLTSTYTGTSPFSIPITNTTSNTINWSQGSTISVDPNIKGNTLQVHGDSEFYGDVTIKGKNITELINNIESRLAILHPNKKLEKKWEKLKKLGDEYRALEKEILHSEEMWDILKK